MKVTMKYYIERIEYMYVVFDTIEYMYVVFDTIQLDLNAHNNMYLEEGVLLMSHTN